MVDSIIELLKQKKKLEEKVLEGNRIKEKVYTGAFAKVIQSVENQLLLTHELQLLEVNEKIRKEQEKFNVLVEWLTGDES